MSLKKPNSADVANRRKRLRLWLDTYFDGSQARFIEDLAAHGHDMNQGELSGLLKSKSFGEKKARHLEKIARMGPKWLDLLSTLAPMNASTLSSAHAATLEINESGHGGDDASIAAAVAIMRQLRPNQRHGAVTLLRAYAATLEPPQDGNNIPVAA